MIPTFEKTPLVEMESGDGKQHFYTLPDNAEVLEERGDFRRVSTVPGVRIEYQGKKHYIELLQVPNNKQLAQLLEKYPKVTEE